MPTGSKYTGMTQHPLLWQSSLPLIPLDASSTGAGCHFPAESEHVLWIPARVM